MKLIVAALALVLAAPAPAASVQIVGLYCLRFVVLENPATVVCVAPLDAARTSLWQVRDLDEFIDQAYATLLLRHPDPPGLAYWRPLLATERFSRAYFVEALIGSNEFCTANVALPRRSNC